MTFLLHIFTKLKTEFIRFNKKVALWESTDLKPLQASNVALKEPKVGINCKFSCFSFVKC